MFKNKSLNMDAKEIPTFLKQHPFSKTTKKYFKAIAKDFTSVEDSILQEVMNDLCAVLRRRPIHVFTNACMYLRVLNNEHDYAHPITVNDKKLLIVKLNDFHWEIEDIGNKAHVGFINYKGYGNLRESTKIAFYLQKPYLRQGIGTAILKRYLKDVTPDGGVFEAMGMQPGSKALILSVGFKFDEKSQSYLYYKK